jgi:hypothetical protein
MGRRMDEQMSESVSHTDRHGTHSLVRTSPKGQDFVGRCVLCGQEGLPMIAALLKCPNPRGVSNDQAVLDAILGEE